MSMPMTPPTPFNSSPHQPKSQVILTIPSERAPPTPMNSPAMQFKAAENDNLGAFNLEPAASAGEKSNKEAVHGKAAEHDNFEATNVGAKAAAIAGEHLDGNATGGDNGNDKPAVEVKYEEAKVASSKSSSGSSTRRIIRTVHMDKCVPYQWLRKSCDKGIPCQQCIDTMKARDKQWECYYDPNFVRPTKNSFLPDKYRRMGIRQFKKEPNDPEGNSEVKVVPTNITGAITTPNPSNDATPTTSLQDAHITAVSSLIAAMKADITFLDHILTNGEGDGIRASAQNTIATINEKLHHPKLQVYLQQEQEIMNGPLPEMTKKMLVDQNFGDCMKVCSWRDGC